MNERQVVQGVVGAVCYQERNKENEAPYTNCVEQWILDKPTDLHQRRINKTGDYDGGDGQEQGWK